MDAQTTNQKAAADCIARVHGRVIAAMATRRVAFFGDFRKCDEAFKPPIRNLPYGKEEVSRVSILL